MDLIHKLLNLVVPPFTFFSLCLFLPPYWAFKFFHSILRSIFSENVAGKVVLITGASSGIGEQLAYEYSRRGARLALCGRRQNSLREVADRARAYGSPDAIVIVADVSRVEDCTRLVDHSLTHFGRLGHLVNNAGIASATLLEEATDITLFRPLMETNFWGSVYTTRFALEHLRNSKGKIIVISSAEAVLPTPRTAVYSGSKTALVSFFETLRVEIGPQMGIKIATPGYIESEMTKGKFLLPDGHVLVDQDLRDVLVSIIPVGRASVYANAIVKGALRGDRYLTVPSWYKMMFVWEFMWPEFIDRLLRLTYMTNLGLHPRKHSARRSWIPLLPRISSIPPPSNLLTSRLIRESQTKSSQRIQCQILSARVCLCKPLHFCPSSSLSCELRLYYLCSISQPIDSFYGWFTSCTRWAN